jgi:superfamily II DNA helicase RecQ
MEDQVKALWKLGFYGSVEYINQDKSHEVQQIYRRLAGGELSLLYITPERFRSGGFIRAFLQRLENDGGLEYAVYDEAHCISQWGHEFRPDYLYSGRAVQRYKDTCQYKFPILPFLCYCLRKDLPGL